MNKRILKKKVKQIIGAGYKKKPIVHVDMKNVTAGSKIDVYISNRYEGPTEGVIFAHLNENQNRAVVLDWVFNAGYTHLAEFINHDHTEVDVEVKVSDSRKSYYSIIPPYNRDKESV